MGVVKEGKIVKPDLAASTPTAVPEATTEFDLPRIHTIVPLVSGMGGSITHNPPEVAELVVTDLTSYTQKKRLVKKLHETFISLSKEGIRRVALKVYDGEMPDSVRSTLMSEFDVEREGTDKGGHYFKYMAFLGEKDYLGAIGSGRHPNMMTFYTNTTRVAFENVWTGLNRNPKDVEAFLKLPAEDRRRRMQSQPGARQK